MSRPCGNTRSLGKPLACLVGLGICAVLGATSSTARSQERNFAGSAQASYLHSLTDPSAPDNTLGGFVAEASLKVAVDFHENVSVEVKVCFGCHGFEVDMAYFDIVPADELAIRVGRFNPSFGEFPVRHDPANHRTVDKPLPYDMGRMLRLREWNLGVLPSPYVDTGVEVSGVRWFGDQFQLSYAGYVVTGFQGDRDGFDFDFRQSRSLYYIDNNLRPAVGGRLAFNVDFGPAASMSVGASGMYGDVRFPTPSWPIGSSGPTSSSTSATSTSVRNTSFVAPSSRWASNPKTGSAMDPPKTEPSTISSSRTGSTWRCTPLPSIGSTWFFVSMAFGGSATWPRRVRFEAKARSIATPSGCSSSSTARLR